MLPPAPRVLPGSRDPQWALGAGSPRVCRPFPALASASVSGIWADHSLAFSKRSRLSESTEVRGATLHAVENLRIASDFPKATTVGLSSWGGMGSSTRPLPIPCVRGCSSPLHKTARTMRAAGLPICRFLAMGGSTGVKPRDTEDRLTLKKKSVLSGLTQLEPVLLKDQRWFHRVQTSTSDDIASLRWDGCKRL